MTAALEGAEWSAARPGRTLPPGKDSVSILQEAGWASGPVWKGGKCRPHRDSIPDRPARGQSLYRLSYPAHICDYVTFSKLLTSYAVLTVSCSSPYYFRIGIIEKQHLKDMI